MVVLILGKARSCRVPSLGCSRGWVTWVIWCFTKNLRTRQGALLWWSCQSPVAHRSRLLIHANSFYRGMFKLNAKFNADSLLYSVIFNVTATQYPCSLNSVYCPLLTSTVKSSLFTHAHPQYLLLGSQVTSVSCKPFSFYEQWLDVFLDRSHIMVFYFKLLGKF